MFQKNFAKFEAQVDADVRAAAPEVKLAANKKPRAAGRVVSPRAKSGVRSPLSTSRAY
jgi:hypothetical protein